MPFTFSGFLKLSSAARVKSGGILQFRPEIVPLSLLDTRGRSLNGNSKSQAFFLKHWERQLVRHNLNHSKRSRNSVSLSSRNRLCLTIILKFQPFLLTWIFLITSNLCKTVRLPNKGGGGLYVRFFSLRSSYKRHEHQINWKRGRKVSVLLTLPTHSSYTLTSL